MANKKQVRLHFVKGVYGNNWKRLRERENKTVREFADIIHVSYPVISRIENETDEPTTEQINIYHDYFHVSIDYLVGLTDGSSIDLAQICKYTGLSEKAVKALNTDYKYCFSDSLGAESILSDLISDNTLLSLVLEIYKLELYSKHLIEIASENAADPKKIVNYEEIWKAERTRKLEKSDIDAVRLQRLAIEDCFKKIIDKYSNYGAAKELINGYLNTPEVITKELGKISGIETTLKKGT